MSFTALGERTAVIASRIQTDVPTPLYEYRYDKVAGIAALGWGAGLATSEILR
jgi:hypothetical protein